MSPLSVSAPTTLYGLWLAVQADLVMLALPVVCLLCTLSLALLTEVSTTHAERVNERLCDRDRLNTQAAPDKGDTNPHDQRHDQREVA